MNLLQWMALVWSISLIIVVVAYVHALYSEKTRVVDPGEDTSSIAVSPVESSASS